MAEPNQKPPTDSKNQAPAQPEQRVAAPQIEQREYIARHKIASGARDSKRRHVLRGETLRLTDAEAARLGDAVELKR